MKTEELLQERGSEYGAAWWLTGEIISLLNGKKALNAMMMSGYFYNWVTILCKLIRVLKTPNHLDSWRDIIGYAQLIIDHIESGSTTRGEG